MQVYIAEVKPFIVTATLRFDLALLAAPTTVVLFAQTTEPVVANPVAVANPEGRSPVVVYASVPPDVSVPPEPETPFHVHTCVYVTDAGVFDSPEAANTSYLYPVIAGVSYEFI